MHILPLVLASLALTASAAKPKLPKDAILLSQVKSLTLRANAKTSHRRVSAIPQLTCAGPGCKHHAVDVMRCTNSGTGYTAEDVQWTCVADVPEEFKLGGTEVTCEGYSSSDDERVLKGSCGVLYRLLLTEKGEERFGTDWWGLLKSQSKTQGQDGVKGKEDAGLGLAGWLFAFLFIAVLILILYKAGEGAAQPAARRRRGGNGGGWGGWGGGPGGGDDPPPPYPGKTYTAPNNTEAGWRPGFWSGALGGAAAGYAAGRTGNRTEMRETPRSSGGWFGGGSDNAGSSYRSAPSQLRSSSSSARYESTGFGGTTRR